MAILSGLIECSAGTLDVFEEPRVSRPSVCFQNDILIPEFTVREHLRLFADIMGIPLNPELTQTATMLGLDEKLDSLVSTLSGGQKRKANKAGTS